TTSIDLFIDPSWETEGGAEGYRWAGFWGVATNAAGEIVNYPIIEFTTLGGQAGFRVWESADGGVWHDLGLPAGFAYGDFLTLTLELQADGSFLYRIGSLTYETEAYDAVEIDQVILQCYTQTPDEPEAGHGYEIHWDNLAAGPAVYVAEDTDLTGIEGEMIF